MAPKLFCAMDTLYSRPIKVSDNESSSHLVIGSNVKVEGQHFNNATPMNMFRRKSFWPVKFTYLTADITKGS